MKGGPCGKWENLWGTNGAGRLRIPQEAGGGPSCCCELAGLLEEAARESTGLRSDSLFVFANAFEHRNLVWSEGTETVSVTLSLS